MRRLLKLLLLFLVYLIYKLGEDFFKKGYTYHASAIAFSSFLVLNTAIIFLGTIIKYIPHRELVISKIYEFFPNVSQSVVNLIVQSLENLSAKTQILTLVLVIFFIGNYLRTIEIGFAFVANTKPKTFPIMNYILPFLFGFLMLFYGIVDMTLDVLPKVLFNLHIYTPWILQFLATLKLVINYLAFPVGLFVIYYFLSPVNISWNTTFAVSLILFLTLNPLKDLFTWYVTHILEKNLILTPLASILIFLIWLYTISLFLLLGYRLILLLESLFKEKTD
jgi:membrane protein